MLDITKTLQAVSEQRTVIERAEAGAAEPLSAPVWRTYHIFIGSSTIFKNRIGFPDCLGDKCLVSALTPRYAGYLRGCADSVHDRCAVRTFMHADHGALNSQL